MRVSIDLPIPTRALPDEGWLRLGVAAPAARGFPSGHLVTAVIDTVDALNLCASFLSNGGDGPRNQPFHPARMVKVFGDGWATGAFSAFKIAITLQEPPSLRLTLQRPNVRGRQPLAHRGRPAGRLRQRREVAQQAAAVVSNPGIKASRTGACTERVRLFMRLVYSPRNQRPQLRHKNRGRCHWEVLKGSSAQTPKCGMVGDVRIVIVSFRHSGARGQRDACVKNWQDPQSHIIFASG